MNSTNVEFYGPLGRHFDRFVVQIKANGGQHVSLFATVRRLDRYLARKHSCVTALTREVVKDWFASFSHLHPNTQRRYRSATFCLCRFLNGRDSSTATAEDFDTVPYSVPFRPYIYSPADVLLLIKVARAQPILPINPLRPWTLELIVILLYTTGLRISEVVRLKMRDFDGSSETLMIRETKFAKSRLVALSQSTRDRVEHYLHRRRSAGLSCHATDSLIWPLRWTPDRTEPSLGSIKIALIRLLRQSGLKPQSGRVGPRIHDMRHSFASTRVLLWYKEGVDVQARLPHLVTYMGHRDLQSTQLYLSVIPDLLDEAAVRFGNFAREGCQQGC